MIKIFNVKRGDRFSFTVTFTNLQGELNTLNLGIKREYDQTMLLTKSLGSGITKVGEGKYQIDFTSEETNALEPGMYHFDMRLSVGQYIYTPLYGYFNINETVFE